MLATLLVLRNNEKMGNGQNNIFRERRALENNYDYVVKDIHLRANPILRYMTFSEANIEREQV